MSWRSAAIIPCTILAGACAVHPMLEDYTGVTSPQIVQQIRCETRAAAIQALTSWLADLGHDHPSQAGVPLARRLAERYKSNPNDVAGFSAALFKGAEFQEVRNVIDIFYSIGVAYNFDLTMTEENDLSAGAANFQSGPANSLFKLGIGGSATRKRNNERTFTVTDTFKNLLTRLNTTVREDGHRDCDGYVVEASYVYPIVGHIGMDKMVYDYLDLTLFGNLAGTKAQPTAPPTMTDDLTFTTTLDASATPKITFTPIGTVFQLTDASLTGEVKRTDMHEVTVGLALPTSATTYLSNLRAYTFAPSNAVVVGNNQHGSRGSLVLGARVIGGGTSSETLAVWAVDQRKSQQFRLLPTQ
jgi:hypothetical protein